MLTNHVMSMFNIVVLTDGFGTNLIDFIGMVYVCIYLYIYINIFLYY